MCREMHPMPGHEDIKAKTKSLGNKDSWKCLEGTGTKLGKNEARGKQQGQWSRPQHCQDV